MSIHPRQDPVHRMRVMCQWATLFLGRNMQWPISGFKRSIITRTILNDREAYWWTSKKYNYSSQMKCVGTNLADTEHNCVCLDGWRQWMPCFLGPWTMRNAKMAQACGIIKKSSSGPTEAWQELIETWVLGWRIDDRNKMMSSWCRGRVIQKLVERCTRVGNSRQRWDTCMRLGPALLERREQIRNDQSRPA